MERDDELSWRLSMKNENVDSVLIASILQDPPAFGIKENNFYLYDADHIAAAFKTFSMIYQGSINKQFFAVKALANPAVMAVLAKEGSGFDCANEQEVKLVRKFLPHAEIFLTANNLTPARLDFFVGKIAYLTVDNLELIPFLDPGQFEQVFVRVRFGGNDDVRVGGHRSKFGICESQLGDALGELRLQGYRRVGLHCMESANVTDYNIKLAEIDKLLTLANARANDNIRVNAINIGGGIGLDYRKTATGFSHERFSEGIKQLKEKHNLPALAVYSEYGRVITGPHGYLVGKVASIHKKPHTVVGLSLSTNAIPRITVYPDAYHHLSFSTLSEVTDDYDVSGNMCESSDIFCRKKQERLPVVGATAIIHDAGAHCISMANVYNGLAIPPEYMLHEGKLLKIRSEINLELLQGTLEKTPVQNMVKESI